MPSLDPRFARVDLLRGGGGIPESPPFFSSTRPPPNPKASPFPSQYIAPLCPLCLPPQPTLTLPWLPLNQYPLFLPTFSSELPNNATPLRRRRRRGRRGRLAGSSPFQLFSFPPCLPAPPPPRAGPSDRGSLPGFPFRIYFTIKQI